MSDRPQPVGNVPEWAQLAAEAEGWVAHLRTFLAEPGLSAERREKIEEIFDMMMRVFDQLRERRAGESGNTLRLPDLDR